MQYILLVILLIFSAPIKAEVFVWKDPKYGIELTFPHDWMRQGKEGDDLRLHILAPQGRDHAACRILASDDNRFLYVPAEGSMDVSQFVQDQKALQALLANRLKYDAVALTGYQAIGGLGKGPATIALAQFFKTDTGMNIPMQAIVFGGYAQGLETFFQCEATIDGWQRWQPVFMNMLASFDFPVRGSSFKNGYYRDFMADGFVYFPLGGSESVGKVRY